MLQKCSMKNAKIVRSKIGLHWILLKVSNRQKKSFKAVFLKWPFKTLAKKRSCLTTRNNLPDKKGLKLQPITHFNLLLQIVLWPTFLPIYLMRIHLFKTWRLSDFFVTFTYTWGQMAPTVVCLNISEFA